MADYNPPSGPPPSWRGPSQDEYAPPPMPPPSQANKQQSGSQSTSDNGGYAPPPGPPPSYQSEYSAPPGAPPSKSQENDETDEPPPYDPWMAVPDNALLPPPPSLREETSPTANATWDEASRAHNWCDRNPLWRPMQVNQGILTRISNGDVRLTSPPNTRNATLQAVARGRTVGRSSKQCGDTIFLSDIPVYSVAAGADQATVYFELQVISMGVNNNSDGEAGVAIGFAAPPYPASRLPGWHRGSLGVHGDDGRRYLDNSAGGQDFTQAFRNGDVVGIGMSMQASIQQGIPNDCKVFFTRNGKKEGGWDLHEERDRDEEDGEVTGLEGYHDLLAAVGIFGGVHFEARFRRDDWLFKP